MEEINVSNLELDIDEALNSFLLSKELLKEHTKTEEIHLDKRIEAFEKQLAQLVEKKGVLVNKLDSQSKNIAKNEHGISTLNESNISKDVSTWKLKSDSIIRDNENTEEILSKRRQLLEQTRREIHLKESFIVENEKKDNVELTAYIKYTQLDLATEKVDYIKFSFKCISQVDPEKIFYFVLHISESREYSVSECQPPIPNIDSLVAKLNADRQLYIFIKKIRKAFVEISKSL